MIRSFVQIASLVFTLEAAFFLANGGLGLSTLAIAELASTRFDYHPELISNLAQQRVDTWTGFAFLVIAFTLQMVHALLPMRWDEAVHKRAAVYALIVGVVVGFGAFCVAGHVAQDTAADVKLILEQRMRGAEPPSSE